VALVAVPVFVTDKNGRAVGGLTAADFEVEEAGKIVPIAAFQAIDVDEPKTPPTEARRAELPAALQAEGPRQFLLLIDLEFSPPAGVMRGRSAAIAFIRQSLAPGDLVSVATWGRAGLKVLTNLTADHEAAARTLEGKGVASNPGVDPLGLSGGFGTLAPTGGRSDEDAAALDALLTQLNAEEYATRVAAFLENVAELVGKLSLLKGRKQMVLLSGGFRESAWNVAISQENRAESEPNRARMQQIFEQAGRGDVVFHAISLHGIPGSLDLTSRTGRSDSRTVDGSVDLRTGVDLASGRTTLTTITKNTGGYFIQPTNDFGRALHEVDRISRKSYVIAFEAGEVSSASGDAKSRSLKIRVRRPGLQVSHRASYVPPAPTALADAGVFRSQAAEAIAKGITGGPLGLHVTAVPAMDPEGKPVVHAVLQISGPDFSKAVQGTELAIEVFGYVMSEGRVLDSIAANAALDLSKFGDALRKTGFSLLTAFPFPHKAADLRFFVRVGKGLTGSVQQQVAISDFVPGQLSVSPPMFMLTLRGRVALPFQPKDRPRLEIPFRIGSEPFVPEGPGSLSPGVVRDVCVFVRRPGASVSGTLDVTAELVRPGEAPRSVPFEGAPRVVADPDGAFRYVLSVVAPQGPPGLSTLRLTFRDPATNQSATAEAPVLINR